MSTLIWNDIMNFGCLGREKHVCNFLWPNAIPCLPGQGASPMTQKPHLVAYFGEPGMNAEYHLLQSQPSALRRHSEEEMLSTCITLRAYNLCPQIRRPGINFFPSFWRCRVLGWVAIFWGSDKGKGEERTGTRCSYFCTWSLPSPTLISCRTMTLVWRGEICSVLQTWRDALSLRGREMIHTSGLFHRTGKCNDLLIRQAVHDPDGKAKAGSRPH